MRLRGPGGRALAAVAGAATVAVVAVAACSGGSNDTLSPIAGGSTGPSATAATPSGSSADPGTSVDPGKAGAGYVQIEVQVASSAVSETISLDRATVSRDALDPVSLDATCTPLDHGDTAKGIDVTVVDLRRLGQGDKFVSAVLHVDGADAGGEQAEHRATLQLSGADQVTTSYSGTVELAAGGWGGTFQMNDPAGNPATGTFACADQAPPPTTVPADTDAGEPVPDTPAPTPPSGT
jgi:hypothetical protein